MSWSECHGDEDIIEQERLDRKELKDLELADEWCDSNYGEWL